MYAPACYPVLKMSMFVRKCALVRAWSIHVLRHHRTQLHVYVANTACMQVQQMQNDSCLLVCQHVEGDWQQFCWHLCWQRMIFSHADHPLQHRSSCNVDMFARLTV